MLQNEADALLAKAQASYANKECHDKEGLSEALGVLYERIDELAHEAEA